MKNDKIKKHVYLLGNDVTGLLAYTYKKEDAKEFNEQRKRSYSIKKVKLNDKVKSLLCDDLEITRCCCSPNYLVTQSEEEYILNSLDQLVDDSIRSINSFLSYYKYLNLTDNEKEDINNLSEFFKSLNKVFEKLDNYDYEEHTRSDLFNMDEVIKFAVKYIL